MFQPLMSTLKSQLVPEKYRATIMSFFRVPVNIVIIVSLVLTKYITTYQICLLCFSFMTVSTLLNAYLIKVHVPPDAIQRKIRRTSELQEYK
jgi:hypothetical protein